jgi:hypothetical protein
MDRRPPYVSAERGSLFAQSSSVRRVPSSGRVQRKATAMIARSPTSRRRQLTNAAHSMVAP